MINGINRLPLHEWCIISLFCLILLLISLFAFSDNVKPVQENTHLSLQPSFSSLESKTKAEKTSLQIKIVGQVKYPGICEFPIKTSLKDVMNRVEPLPNADLSRLHWRRKLKDGQTIRVPERKLIKITVSGAVKNPGEMQIYSGIRKKDLLDQLELLPEADLSFLKRKMSFVMEGDYVKIPFTDTSKNVLRNKKKK